MRLINAFTEAARLRSTAILYCQERDPEATAALKALGDNPHPDVFESTCKAHRQTAHIRVVRQYICNECSQYAPELVEIGEEVTSDSCPARVCAACLVKALKLIDG